MADFRDDMATGYGFEGAAIRLGRPYVDPASPVDDVEIRLPVGLLNRHGLIAGATGTGKTKTLQLIAEQVSAAGSPVFAADMKGDLAGLAEPGEANEKVTARATDLAYPWSGSAAPVELLSLSGEGGVPLRATVSSFGPTLMGKVLSLNETQDSTLSLVYRFCDDKGLPLVELEDLRAGLAYLAGPGKADLESLGGVSKASVGVIQRKVTELESAGADVFFGEPELDVRDLLRTTPDGRGVVSVLSLTDVAEQPALFSTFLMWVLAELFETLPEVGDPDKPTLVFFLDEAHLLFDGATKGFIDSVSRTVRLVRSKGVGVFFVTQLPTDLPDEVLAQLGHRVQHAVRAFTPKDAKALRQVTQTYPITEHYQLDETLQSLGVGEAVVTVLNPRGVPTPVAATRLFPPASRMSPLTPDERQALIAASLILAKYEHPLDRASAKELLEAKAAGDAAKVEEVRAKAQPAPRAERPPKRDDDSLIGEIGDILGSRQGKSMQKEVVRGIFGLLRKAF